MKPFGSPLIWIALLGFAPSTQAFLPTSSRTAFDARQTTAMVNHSTFKQAGDESANALLQQRRHNRESSLSLTATSFSVVLPFIRSHWGWFLASASFVLCFFRHKLLWPNTATDPSHTEPVPPGNFGCPLFGHNLFAGSKKDGPETFYWKMSKALGHPKLWKFYSLGHPSVAVTGSELVTQVQSLEFSDLESTSWGGANPDAVYVTDNLMFEPDRKRHRFLRNLVGSTMTPAALATAVPSLQRLAKDYIQQLLTQGKDASPVCMDTICQGYTMDIAQTQIFGLDSQQQDDEFQNKLRIWLRGMYSLWVNSGILVRYTKAYKAKQYLKEVISKQMDHFKEAPNSSILSNMMHAVDNDDNGSKAKLTEKQVMDNALLLVAAGMETSSSTLTLLMMLLSLHPRVYQKLANEVCAAVGDDRDEEDKSRSYEKISQLPYLDAVVKEALRIGPVTGGFPRKVKNTIVVEGYQIPKGWSVFGNYRLSHYLDPVTRQGDDSHMDPRSGFQPERWLSPETTPSDFLAFGAGPRYCLGANLAMLEIKIFLVELVQKISFLEMVAKTVEWNQFSMIPKPSDGALVIVEPRSQRGL